MAEVRELTIATWTGAPVEELAAQFAALHLTAALISTPNRFHVARIDVETGEAFTREDGQSEQPVDFSTAYDIRAFGEKAELRWVRSGAAGDVTILAERAVPTRDGVVPAAITCPAPSPRSYYLWGTVAADTPPEGKWSVLHDWRIGSLHVPRPAAKGQRIKLEAREYVVRGREGNAAILAERLIGFIKE